MLLATQAVAQPAAKPAESPVPATEAKAAPVKKMVPIADEAPAKAAPKPTVEKKEVAKPAEPDHLVPPLIWGCEDEWKLQFGGATSFRNEYRHNFDMRSEVGDNDHLSFMRTFLNLDLTYRQVVRVFFEVMDARVFDSNTDVMQSDHWDISALFVELKDCPESPWTLRLGRQRLPIISEGRLWGLPPTEYYWWNFVPHFEGAMLDYKTKDVTAHFFLLQPLSFATLREGVMTTDRGREVNHLWHYGVYSQFKTWSPHVIDLYFLGLSDRNDSRTWPGPNLSEQGRNGTVDRYTVGANFRGPIKKWDGCGTLGYGFEAAYQFGHASNNDIKAGMLHADLNYVWEHPWKPKLTLLGNLATGDRVAGDDESNRFSSLFGSSHYGYGTIDFFRLSNMREIGLTYSFEPCEKVKILTEYHHFWLDSRTDAWGSPIGIAFGRDPSGQSGRDAGDEIDLTMTYKHNKRWQSEAGLAYFLPGNFAKKQGRNDGARFLFLQTVYKF
jgi:hypothetical protein